MILTVLWAGRHPLLDIEEVRRGGKERSGRCFGGARGGCLGLCPILLTFLQELAVMKEKKGETFLVPTTSPRAAGILRGLLFLDRLLDSFYSSR